MLENTRFNPQWQQAHAVELAKSQRMNDQCWAAENARSKAAHPQRMAAINSGARSASDLGKTYSDSLDISQEGYLKRGNMVEAGQSREVDMTGEMTVVFNPGTGERYQAEAGSRHYWYNNVGQWFGADNSLYDPRSDQRVNDKQWTHFSIEQ